jgi:hypothetical protein
MLDTHSAKHYSIDVLSKEVDSDEQRSCRTEGRKSAS